MNTFRSEWTKLRTVRGTAWLPAVSVALFVGLSAAVSAAAAPGTTACAGGCDAARVSLAGVYGGQAVVVALAVLAVTMEYDTGLIATTLAATPRRMAVFAAKAATVVCAVVPAAAGGVAGSLLGGHIVSTGNGFPARPALGTVLYLAFVALLSFGVATALRHTAPALTAVLALLYLAPLLARIAPDERWHTRIERYAPMTAGLAVQSTTDSPAIGPWTGLAVLAGYAAVAMALGAALFTARDA